MWLFYKEMYLNTDYVTYITPTHNVSDASLDQNSSEGPFKITFYLNDNKAIVAPFDSLEAMDKAFLHLMNILDKCEPLERL